MFTPCEHFYVNAQFTYCQLLVKIFLQGVNDMNKIKELRLERGYSMEQLAQKIGIGKSSISQYESNQRTPSTDTQEALADLFNVDVDYLMGRTTIRRRIDLEEFITSEVSSQEIKIIKAYRNASSTTKAAIDLLLGIDNVQK